MTDTEILNVRISLSRCQGLLEGIYLGISTVEDFNKQGALNSLNEAVDIIQKSIDNLTIKEEPKY